MKITRSAMLIVLLLAATSLPSCTKKDTTATTPDARINSTVLNLPATPFDYSNIAYPAHVVAALATQDNTPANNTITNDGATLGRVLFYDKNLSKNNTISCASCHQPAAGFTDAAALRSRQQITRTFREKDHARNIIIQASIR